MGYGGVAGANVGPGNYPVAGAGVGPNVPYPVAGANVGPGHYPVAGVSHCAPVVGGVFSNVGIILVLFILLVIVSRACLW
ncbi:hypothetical protein [Paenibacillus sp. Soil522]|uniref:hypothetical protein n=1 Tax=Paenibacillus sp. Soil522 TaxID=1736388 RepID=UPI0006F1FFA6|nr:hypothetical protein [Paenibacillus sp. Soil522]KRE32666.1 hypothetical protein ASG81_24375 [Paenibacillus sp. Soil522]